MKRLHKILFIVICAFNIRRLQKSKQQKIDCSRKDFFEYYKALCDIPYY